MSNNKIEKLYGIDDEEHLHDNIEDCVQLYIDNMIESEIPEEVQVCVYERVKINEEDLPEIAGYISETLIEHLYDTYSDAREEYYDYDPDFNIDDITIEYVKKVCSMFTPYNCERTGEIIVVKTKDYL